MNLKTSSLIAQYDTHQFIGGKWRKGILWNLRNEHRRYGQLKRDDLGLYEKMLFQELKHLQMPQIINRKAYPEIPPSIEYSLTSKGKTLIPLIEGVVEWGYSDMEKYKTNANNLYPQAW